MPKIIELTVELNVQKVSCPGVWLCQDGRVSLSIFTLGTSYQTCMLPPMFPLMYKDVFYFRKRFHETCALNNICCLLKDETIYCELVQWCEDCMTNECIILAQYLGCLNDVLFPPNMCSSEGVDLLMRRTSDFPGILSPKIEICTKVRIDEVWDQNCCFPPPMRMKSCDCARDVDGSRQKQVCHSSEYHRSKCTTSASGRRPPSVSRSRSRVRAGDPRSCCSLPRRPDDKCCCPAPPPAPPPPRTKSRVSVAPCGRLSPRRARSRHRNYSVYSVEVPAVDNMWRDVAMNGHSSSDYSEGDDDVKRAVNEDNKDEQPCMDAESFKRTVVESHYIDDPSEGKKCNTKSYSMHRATPCVCEICRRYHELFHTNA